MKRVERILMVVVLKVENLPLQCYQEGLSERFEGCATVRLVVMILLEVEIGGAAAENGDVAAENEVAG